MYKKDLTKFVIGAGLTFVVVCAIGFLCVNALKRKASLVARDTLPGLMYAGAANNQMAANFLASVGLADLKTPADQNTYLQRTEAISKKADAYFKKYQETILDAADRANFARAVAARGEYDKARQQFFGLVRDGRRDDALACFKSAVEPAYDKYESAGTALLDYNIKTGQSRGEELLKLSYVTPIIVGLFGVVIFIAGAMFGFRATLP